MHLQIRVYVCATLSAYRALLRIVYITMPDQQARELFWEHEAPGRAVGSCDAASAVEPPVHNAIRTRLYRLVHLEDFIHF